MKVGPVRVVGPRPPRHPYPAWADLPGLWVTLDEVRAIRGDPVAPEVAERVALMARLYSRVEVDGSCLIWKGARSDTGYGSIRVGRTTVATHRLAYELAVGPIPDGLQLRHACDVRACVAWRHLSPGSALENSRDMRERGRSLSGERNTSARLTTAQVVTIRRAYAMGGLTQAALAARYGVARSTISRALRGVDWASIPGALPASRVRLTASDVATIRRAAAEGVTYKTLAQRFGVHRGTISNVARRRTWATVPDPGACPPDPGVRSAAPGEQLALFAEPGGEP